MSNEVRHLSNKQNENDYPDNIHLQYCRTAIEGQLKTGEKYVLLQAVIFNTRGNKTSTK
jgi:hypothetical protein